MDGVSVTESVVPKVAPVSRFTHFHDMLTAPPSGSFAVAAHESVVDVVIVPIGVIAAAAVKTGGLFTTVTVFVIASVAEFASSIVAVHEMSSPGEEVDGESVMEAPEPSELPVVVFVHAYDQFTVVPSGSLPVPVQLVGCLSLESLVRY